MSIPWVLLSFKGRLSRRDYWLKGFLPLVPVGIIVNILNLSTTSDGARLVALLLSFASLWPGLALMVKRLHDRNRSGWWIATAFVPILGVVALIWLLIEVWFLRGTLGSNRFGMDPVRP